MAADKQGPTIDILGPYRSPFIHLWGREAMEIIEKRRRDRINNSLTELRRLVPAAFEKQGSAKLEKAEILQMTVDHLKYLHAKGIDGSFHPYGEAHAYAMDYRVLGLRECASEVARYLVTVEGMDLQDPLRLRLLSHLQCYMAQREIQSRQHWNSVSSGHPGQFPAHTHGQTPGLPHNSVTSSDPHAAVLPPPPTGPGPESVGTRQMLPIMPTTSNHENQHQGSCHSRIPAPQPGSITTTAAGSCNTSTNLSTPVAPSIPAIHPQYPVTYNSLQVLSPNGYSATSGAHNAHTTIVSKPYRPWGAEMAY
ncbi:putative hairy/enhancer-of-split related with YRPW motif protein 1 [Apostichopus japonicus]|uniref:Putative hairy/enhancer-of-split related with YRPW motif protein 1 n=1 Tax=Stichopus japonicus TaxID=307972 RepID=A0A2G8JWA6_STIJA|nr:putative hairy/enhancer-of-split related with YRPW motif protein 1 [Apostichopus japonicus]